MDKTKPKFATIDEYIRSFPEPVHKMLQELREVIRKQAPQAQEKISYQMPAYFLNGRLLYFAAFSGHIGFYPMASGIEAFESELSEYKHAKGSVQFPIGKPLPIKLIKKIIKFRVGENLKKMKKR